MGKLLIEMFTLEPSEIFVSNFFYCFLYRSVDKFILMDIFENEIKRILATSYYSSRYS